MPILQCYLKWHFNRKVRLLFSGLLLGTIPNKMGSTANQKSVQISSSGEIMFALTPMIYRKQPFLKSWQEIKMKQYGKPITSKKNDGPSVFKQPGTDNFIPGP